MNNNQTLKIAAAALVASACVYSEYEKHKALMSKKKYKARSYVMLPNSRAALRAQLGHQNILAEMRLQDESRFINYLRMPADIFDKLLGIVGPNITKSSMGPNLPIDASVKLAMTLR